MTADDAISLYTNLETLKIKVWIDGGWGVDALLGGQTRRHQDLDVVVQQKDVPRLRRLLEERGYRDIKLEEARPWNSVLGDENGREIDLHVIVLDDNEQRLRPAYGSAGLSCPLKRVPSGHRRPQTTGVCASPPEFRS
jgi:lincosamide nucleotidyltransferase A/C/D/E